MKTLIACLLLLQYCLTALADTNTTTTRTANAVQLVSQAKPAITLARTATTPTAKQPTIKMDLGLQSPQVETNRAPVVERVALKIEEPARRDFFITGRFYWPSGIEVGFNLQPGFAPYPRDSGVDAQFEFLFPLEKRWGRKK